MRTHRVKKYSFYVFTTHSLRLKKETGSTTLYRFLLPILLLAPGSALADPSVSLSVAGGKMVLNWKAINPGSYDYVALYDGDPRVKGVKGYLDNQWQWATKSSSYKTGTDKGFNYYIAYIAQACRTCEPSISATAGPYVMPKPSVSLSISTSGYMTLNWNAAQPGNKDFVALYDGVPDAKGTKKYLTEQWQWATKGPSYTTKTKEGLSYYIAYVESDQSGNMRIAAQDGPYSCLTNEIKKGTNPIRLNEEESGDGYVQVMNSCLGQKFSKTHDTGAFALSTDNILPTNWIAQTPNVWGKTAAEVGVNAGIFIANDLQKMISGAQQFVDITTLSPYPDDTFRQYILAGLTEVAKSGREVTVRILAGWPITSTFTSDWPKGYLDFFANPISKIKNNRMSFYVAAQRTDLISWNHSKIVAVDGKYVMLGGQNFWTNDYLGTTPVHDLNVILKGSAAYNSHKYIDILWNNVCGYKEQSWKPWSWKHGESTDKRNCLANSNIKNVSGPQNVSVLGAGRYGTLKDSAGSNIQPSDYAMVLALNASKRAIRIAQQDLAFTGGVLYWEDGMKAIADSLLKKQQVYIVLSNEGSKAGNNPYSNTSLKNTADKIRSYVKNRSNLSADQINDLLCKNLNLSTLRFGPSDTWPNGTTFANHSKFLMVDDDVFYVGSANFYPSDLAEYGVFISNKRAVVDMRKKYYDKLWSYSSSVAISGGSAKKCYFTHPDEGFIHTELR